MIRITSATRHSQEHFAKHALLGTCLSRILFREETALHLAFNNKKGLPEIYNDTIERSGPDDILVFVHDDVWIEDWMLAGRLTEGLSQFDVIGVAGNVRRLPRQPAWAFSRRGEREFVWDDKQNLSGAVAHMTGGNGVAISDFGPTPRPVKLLDGVFLAASGRALKSAGVSFDTRFDFHFYDLDFCRSCETANLRLGTWPIALVHASAGSFGSPAWTRAYTAYLDKWGD